MYGRKRPDGTAMVTGIVLMVYPYFIGSFGRTDKNVVWVLMPGEKMYIEYPLQTKNTVAGFHKLPNEIERKFIATKPDPYKKIEMPNQEDITHY